MTTDLDFITDTDLRKKIENSIEYVFVLFEKSKNEKEKDLFREETHRVIILYIISIIEAVLLYVYKKRNEELTKLEYKFVTTIPNEYKNEKEKDFPVVIAVQKKIKKQDHEIGLFELVNFFKDKKLMMEKTVEKILEINDIRNTFHFNKSRSSVICDIKHVESAFSLLVYVIEKVPKVFKK